MGVSTATDHRSKKVSTVKRNLKKPVKSRIDSNPGSSIRKIASALNSTYYSVRTSMKKDLQLTPYKYRRCQTLTEADMQQRIEFYRWVLVGNIEPKNIIFTDEKWYYLRSSFNRQNTRHWSIENQHINDPM